MYVHLNSYKGKGKSLYEVSNTLQVYYLKPADNEY